MGAAGAALLLHLLLLQKGQTQGTSINTVTMDAVQDGKVTLPGGLKKNVTFIQWTFRSSPGTQATNICKWYPHTDIVCNSAYWCRVELYVNTSLTIHYLRYADSGWYHVVIKYGSKDEFRRNIHLKVHASASQTDQIHLILILGMLLCRCLLW